MTARVLHVVYNLMRGGTEGQCARTVIGLAGLGLSHSVAVFRREGFFLEDVERICGRVHEVRVRRMVSWPTLREVCRLASHVKRGSYDLLHAWDADAAIFGSWAARLAGVAYLTSHRDLGQIYNRRKMALMRWADRGARAVVVNARIIAERLSTSGIPPGKIRLIPNQINLEEFDRLAGAKTAMPVLPTGRRVGVVCRLDPEKNVACLIRALTIIRRVHKDVVLVIAGDGVERPALEALCRTLNVNEQVCFLGDTAAVPGLLRHIHIGALVPSANEGLSNSVLEYMAASLPVVVSDCGGNRELVEEGCNGLIVPSDNPEALAAAISNLCENRARAVAMGKANRAKVEKYFAPPMILEQYRAFYEEINCLMNDKRFASTKVGA